MAQSCLERLESATWSCHLACQFYWLRLPTRDEMLQWCILVLVVGTKFDLSQLGDPGIFFFFFWLMKALWIWMKKLCFLISIYHFRLHVSSYFYFYLKNVSSYCYYISYFFQCHDSCEMHLQVLFCSTEIGRSSFVRQLEPDWHIDSNPEIISQLAVCYRHK